MDKELIQAMLDGKVLVCKGMKGDYNTSTGMFGQWHSEPTHFGDYEPMDFSLDWQRMPEPKTRVMTIGEVMVFCADNPRIVMKNKYSDVFYASMCISSDANITDWRWNELEDDGTLRNEGWQEFEVVE